MCNSDIWIIFDSPLFFHLQQKLCNELSKIHLTTLLQVVRQVIFQPNDFHPRYSAVAKEYVYRIYDGRTRNPFLNGLAYHYIGTLNVDLINKAAKYFVGTHDFRSFMANGSKIIDTVRTIYYCDFVRKDDYCELKICGDGFLYNMVRIIVGTLLFVNEGRINETNISDLILALDRNKAGKTAPPHGLYLNKVFYDKKELENYVRKL